MPEIHRRIVREIIEEEKIKPGIIAINVFGSLAKGNEKLNSDIDIQIVSKCATIWSLENKDRYGIKIDFEIYPMRKLKERVEKYPFLCYIYLDSKTVYDPADFMREILEDINKYFKDNPKVLKFWVEKQKIKEDLKKKGLGEGFTVKCYDEAEILFSGEHRVTRDFFKGK